MVRLQFFYYLPTIALTFFLALTVLLNNRKKLENVMFALFSTSILLWLVVQFIADISSDNSVSLFFIRMTILASLAIGAMFIILVDALVSGNKPHRRLWLGAVGYSLLFVPVAFIPSTVTAVTHHSWGVEAQYGATYYAFLLYSMSVFIYTLYIAFLRKTSKSSRARAQLRLVYAGILSTLVVNVLTNIILPNYGLPQEYGVAFGVLSVLFIIVFTAYAVIKHRLFDIRAVVARSVTYVLSVVSIGAFYGFIAFGTVGEFLTAHIFTNETGKRTIYSILAVILAFTFPTIRRFFERVTDRVLYRDRYDPQLLVSSIGRVLASEIRLDPLSKRVAKILQDSMRVTSANIIVLGQAEGEDTDHANDEANIYYQTQSDKNHQDYKIEDISTIRLPVVITDELASSDERDMLERHNIRAALSLRTKEEFIGYLLLGDKRSGDIYSDQDIQTLRIIANELAVAIQNARSYQEIQQFNETLKDKIKLATTDLSHANRELKALDKAKDEFISMASHQLRTPLTAVRGYTSMVMEGDFGKVTGEQKDTLKQSFDAATRMTRLVDDLLNVSRIQSGKFRIERAEVDLNKVLPEELGLIETTATAKKVKVTFHAPKTPVPMLIIDEGKTRQCLMNLMDNAVYYSSTAPSGGKVDVYLEADKNDVSFRVVDNGIGVPRDQQAKLFKKFYRAPNAQKTRPDGTGLGLFLVGKVVKDQAGEIIFESAENKGSTFGFKLPIKPAGEGLTPEKEVAETPKAIKEPAKA